MTNSTPLTERQQYWFQLPNGAVVAFSGNVDAAIDREGIQSLAQQQNGLLSPIRL